MANKQKFWNWTPGDEQGERVLSINGTIAEESWFDDDVTPGIFKKELDKGKGDVVVWLNSPGGDCVAASQIFSMLLDYPGKVTVKIDGIADSAASVIAMAGDEVLMAPTASMMIHNPLTMAWGNKQDMEQVIQMLDSVKESIINAYKRKSGLDRDEISKMMDAETWMDAGVAIEKGFADGILERRLNTEDLKLGNSMEFSRKATAVALLNKMAPKISKSEPKEEIYFSADELLKNLNTKKR